MAADFSDQGCVRLDAVGGETFEEDEAAGPGHESVSGAEAEDSFRVVALTGLWVDGGEFGINVVSKAIRVNEAPFNDRVLKLGLEKFFPFLVLVERMGGVEFDALQVGLGGDGRVVAAFRLDRSIP